MKHESNLYDFGTNWVVRTMLRRCSSANDWQYVLEMESVSVEFAVLKNRNLICVISKNDMGSFKKVKKHL